MYCNQIVIFRRNITVLLQKNVKKFLTFFCVYAERAPYPIIEQSNGVVIGVIKGAYTNYFGWETPAGVPLTQ